MKLILILTSSITVLLSFFIQAAGDSAATTKNINPNQHFDPLGKPPSVYTLKAIEQDSAGLPFDDTRDFDEAAKGFIAEPDIWKVLGPEGNVVWDLHRYDFFRSDKDFPSRWRE